MTRNLNISWKPSFKQMKAFNILEDNETTELFFGGAAGGGKSYFGCAWLILNCLRYPGTRWLMGRAVLKSLKDSTLLTFFEICSSWGLVKDEDYKYNSTDNIITFIKTGSTVYLKDLFAYPSDPEFDSLGSTEYTGSFMDEGSQVTVKAHKIVTSRIRFKLDEYGLIPKSLICSNPSKNFLYYDFYKPYRADKLPKYRKFVPSLVQDNPYISKHYIENLQKLDEVSKQRLLYGNFEYDDDQSKLFEYEDILHLFDVEEPEVCSRIHYISVDVARFGDDKTVLILWRGMYIKKIYVYAKQSLKQTVDILQEVMKENGVLRENVIVDEDGVGGGVIDFMPGVKGFINNSRAFELRRDNNPKGAYTGVSKHNYANLKSQCYWVLSKYLKEGRIGVYKEVNEQVKELMIEDLEQIKQKDIDKDGPLAIIPKQEIKEKLGRSTDFSDALMMRMFFELKKTCKPYASTMVVY